MTGLADQIRRAFAAQCSGGRTLAEDTNFFEAGLTSARLAAAVADLRAQGAEVTLIDAFTWPTLRELTDVLVARGGRPAGPSPATLPWER